MNIQIVITFLNAVFPNPSSRARRRDGAYPLHSTGIRSRRNSQATSVRSLARNTRERGDPASYGGAPSRKARPPQFSLSAASASVTQRPAKMGTAAGSNRERGGGRRRGALRLAPRVRVHVHRGRRLPAGFHGRPDPGQLRLRRADPGRGMRVAPRGNAPGVRALARARHGQGAAGSRVVGQRPPVTARDVAILASIGTKTAGRLHRPLLRAVLGRVRDGPGSEKTCVGAIGSLFDGSPVVIEFFACVAVASLLVLPWLLPAHRARRAFLRVLWDCLGYAFCFPAFGPFASKTTTDGDARDAAAMRRQNSVRERLLAAGGEGETDETNVLDTETIRIETRRLRGGLGDDAELAVVVGAVARRPRARAAGRRRADIRGADAVAREFTACLFVASSWRRRGHPGRRREAGRAVRGFR